MKSLEQFLSLYLSPVEAYGIFSRSFSGERFLPEPDIEQDISVFPSIVKELEYGHTNRFFWQQLLGYLPFAYTEINDLIKNFGGKELRKPKKADIQCAPKYRLMREALLALDSVNGLRNGRFQLEKEHLSTMGSTFFQGFDLIHGQSCTLIFSSHVDYEQMEYLLDIAQLPNRNLVPILDFGIHEEQFYVVISAHEPISPTDDEECWSAVMKSIFYAYDSLHSRDIPLGRLSRYSLYPNAKGKTQVFVSGDQGEEVSSCEVMSMVGQEIWKGSSPRVSFVIAQLSKKEDAHLDELLDLFEKEVEHEREEQGKLIIDVPDEITIFSWFSKGKKSIPIRNVGNGPLALVIRSSHQALRVIQENPNPHRLEQLIDLEFDPVLLDGESGIALLEFETDTGIETRTVYIKRAFWLWPVVITTVILIVILWVFL